MKILPSIRFIQSENHVPHLPNDLLRRIIGPVLTAPSEGRGWDTMSQGALDKVARKRWKKYGLLNVSQGDMIWEG